MNRLRLSEPTPRKYTDRWRWLSILYLAVCFLNENYDLIMSLGVPIQYHGWIRFIGLIAYTVFTTFIFNQSTYDQKLSQ